MAEVEVKQKKTKEEKKECIICVETINKSTHKIVKCEFCDYEACVSCVKKYLLNEDISKCMSCKKEWSRKFIKNNITPVFLNTELKEHYKNILFNKEISFLPETQKILENKINQERLKKKQRKFEKELVEITNNLTKINLGVMPLINEVSAMLAPNIINIINNIAVSNEIKNEILENQKNLIEITENKIKLEFARYEINNLLTEIKKEINTDFTVKYVKSCQQEECKGFLNEEYKCGICNFYTCSKCNIVTGTDIHGKHECDPDDVKTTELLNADTKPCPTCGMGIFKIDGCDQMWCTQCKTAFSFITGTIETTIHNPHYYEWMRKEGRTIPRATGDNVCGEEDTINYRIIRKIMDKTDEYVEKNNITDVTKINEDTKYILECCRKLTECRAYIDKYRLIEYTFTYYGHLRELYIQNKITKEKFKEVIITQEIARLKENEIRGVKLFTINALTDVILSYVNTKMNEPDWNGDYTEPIKEIKEIFNIANTYLPNIKESYGCSIKPIGITYLPNIKESYGCSIKPIGITNKHGRLQI